MPLIVLVYAELELPSLKEEILVDLQAIFTAGYKAVLHIHSIVEECEIMKLIHQIDPKTKQPIKKKLLFVKSGAIVVVRIQVSRSPSF